MAIRTLFSKRTVVRSVLLRSFPSPKPQNLHGFCSHAVQHSHPAGAADLVNNVSRVLERGCSLDVLAYNSYLEALCKGGNVDADEADEIFRGTKPKGVSPDACTYSTFIRANCKTDVQSVFCVLDRVRRYDLLPNVSTYNCVIKKLCKNEKVEEAYQLKWS